MRTRILIVDDDQGMLDSLVMALEDEFELGTASNGQEALDVMARERFDVVLLDLMMPVLDGEGYLREHVQRHAAVPVLLVSADRDLARRASDLGGLDYLAKPFVLATLESKLRRLAGGQGGGGNPAPPASSGAGASGSPKPARRARQSAIEPAAHRQMI